MSVLELLAVVYVALVVAGAACVIYFAATSPLGYEDERGFHLGQPPEEREALERLERSLRR